MEVRRDIAWQVLLPQTPQEEKEEPLQTQDV